MIPAYENRRGVKSTALIKGLLLNIVPIVRVRELSSTVRIKESWLIYPVAFICGAIVMSLEILGSRLLVKNYGGSVLVWGSLISVFLAGLSTGYYFGGKSADSCPSTRKLGFIVLVAGLILMMLPLYHSSLSDWIFSLNLGERAGALLDATFSFFVPSMLLGAVSPFCARIMMRSLASSGRTIGTLYALATAGSIAGTLLTSFYLIASAGIKMLLMYHGVLLVLVSLPFFCLKPYTGQPSA